MRLRPNPRQDDNDNMNFNDSYLSWMIFTSGQSGRQQI